MKIRILLSWCSLVSLAILTQLNAQTNTFPSSGNVGIGTTSPTSMLVVSGEGSNYTYGSLLLVSSNNAGFGGGATLSGVQSARAASGGGYYFSKFNNPTGTQFWVDSSGDSFFAGNVGVGTSAPNATLDIWNPYSSGTDSLRFSYNDGSAYWMGLQPYVVGAGNVGYKFRTTNGNATVDALAITGTGNIGIGTQNPTYPLSVNGTIQAKEVIVQTGWSDYVFDRDYRLAPLSEIKRQIETQHHLPGMPSSAEVTRAGVSVGEMQAKLLAKIEELTLHQIEMEEHLERLENENSELRKSTQK